MTATLALQYEDPMKHLLLLILVALSAACGGAEFSPAGTVGDGGDGSVTGTAGVTVTGGGTGGALNQGGGAGHVTGGSAAAGADAAGSPSGGAPAICEFDAEQMMAALPTEIDLGDFAYTSGELCVTCKHHPCRKVPVISWGTPRHSDDKWLIYPNIDTTMVNLNIGDNDGVCAMKKECGTKPDQPAVVLVVEQGGEGWVVAEATFSMTFFGNACTNEFASGTYLNDMTRVIGNNVSRELVGLKIPCSQWRRSR